MTTKSAVAGDKDVQRRFNGIVSGRAAAAWVWHGNEQFSIEFGDPDGVLPRESREFHLLFCGVNDFQYFTRDTRATIYLELTDAVRRCRALDLALLLLDFSLSSVTGEPVISDDTRASIAEELEGLLAFETRQTPGVAGYVRRVLYSKRLAPPADIEKARGFAPRSGEGLLQKFLDRLDELQPAIGNVFIAWNEIDDSLFDSPEARNEVESLCVRAGVFKWFVQAVDRRLDYKQVIRKAKQCEGLKAVASLDRILSSWASCLKQVGSRVREMGDAILHEIGRGRLGKADELIDGLVGYQRDRGGASQASKTLSNLATRLRQSQAPGSRAVRRISMQFAKQLAARSTKLAPTDPRAWFEYGESLRESVQLDEACAAYARSLELGDSEQAFVGLVNSLRRKEEYGRALEMYKQSDGKYSGDTHVAVEYSLLLDATGRHDDAIATIDRTISSDPGNAVPLCIKGHLLRDGGDLVAALASYDRALALRGDDLVAANGRAEVLKARCDYEGALRAYERVLAVQPMNIVARNGKAEVEKLRGRLPVALGAYDDTIEHWPYDEFTLNGRASVLKAWGRYEDALRAYDGALDEFPESIAARNGKAEVFRAQGNHDKALEAYMEVLKMRPGNLVAATGRAETLKALGRHSEALEILNDLVSVHRKNVVARTARADLMRTIHLVPEALVAYEGIVGDFPHDRRALRGLACALISLDRCEEALQKLPAAEKLESLDDWIGYHIRGMALLKLGRLDEAMAVFSKGLVECPFESQVHYFRTALSMVWLRQGEHENAEATLSHVDALSLKPLVLALLVHVCGELGKSDQAKAHYEQLVAIGGPVHRYIGEELESRYVTRVGARHDDRWLADHEIHLFLAA
jgi:tetratricopeptide (TPR) repeat protein